MLLLCLYSYFLETIFSCIIDLQFHPPYNTGGTVMKSDPLRNIVKIDRPTTKHTYSFKLLLTFFFYKTLTNQNGAGILIEYEGYIGPGWDDRAELTWELTQADLTQGRVDPHSFSGQPVWWTVKICLTSHEFTRPTRYENNKKKKNYKFLSLNVI